jgi:hypothetical protein
MTMMTTIELTHPLSKTLMDGAMNALDKMPDKGWVVGYPDGEFLNIETFSSEPLFAATIFEHDTDAMEVAWYGPGVDRDKALVMTMKQAKAVAHSAVFEICVGLDGWMAL